MESSGHGEREIPRSYRGRYLCRDPLGICFEKYDDDKPTGRRMWLTDAGFFCSDLGTLEESRGA